MFKNFKVFDVTLNRTLSFNVHLTKIAQKLKTKNSIIQKLRGTTWDSSASSLRSAALELVYSAAEHCAP